MRVVINEDERLEIAIEGYGEKTTETGFGSVAYLEKDPNNGEMYLYVWADINREDYTHKICLSEAKENKRQN